MSLIEYRLNRALGDWESALKSMGTLREVLANVEAEIGEDRTLTDEQKGLMIQESRRRMSLRIERAVAQAREAEEDLSRAIADGWKGRTVGSESRARVRAYLERGDAPGDIISTALRTGDAEALAALRVEAPWHKVGDTSFDTPEIMEAVDAAMLEVGDPGDKDLAQVARKAQALSEVGKRSAELSLSQASGRVDPTARIALGLAEAEVS